ncbi:MAG: siphovirus Gp157 family protein [Chroococcidiopsidaceae cyanobacterium CP_BM_ER_R8_30]|nr:siphovirus Gp157 family protein [Chroococcidiopsidaceae cyanobacterium CP_BM_ER_R8_30]
MTEPSAFLPVNPSPPEPQPRSLFQISDDLERLNTLLDDAGDDTQQQELLAGWFEQLGTERDRKLDGYAALITEMQARAEVRKAEAKRLMALATADEQRAKLLKERLKWFFETHRLKTVETPRYRLSLAKNGGKAPLILKEGIEPEELPERFQEVSVAPNTAVIRAALEAGEVLDFAQLGDRGTSLKIK